MSFRIESVSLVQSQPTKTFIVQAMTTTDGWRDLASYHVVYGQCTEEQAETEAYRAAEKYARAMSGRTVRVLMCTHQPVIRYSS